MQIISEFQFLIQEPVKGNGKIVFIKRSEKKKKHLKLDRTFQDFRSSKSGDGHTLCSSVMSTLGF